MFGTQFMKRDNSFEITFPEHIDIKESRPGYKVPSVLLQACPVDPSLCVLTHVKNNRERNY